MIYAFALIEKVYKCIYMNIYSKVKRKENTNVPTLKIQQKPTKIGESDKTCTLIAALTMIE